VKSPVSERPPLAPELSRAEFLRWYWLKDELALFARSAGLKATGSKALLTERIAAALDGQVFEEPAGPMPRPGSQLSEPLFNSTPIPAGQRCSQIVRRWLANEIGPAFHFDASMREYFANADGTQTMQGAIEHWNKTRNGGPRAIDSQFEYNRFTRDWHEANPCGSRDQLLAAWNLYRSRPIDERGRV
jgi:hypothetical protein